MHYNGDSSTTYKLGYNRGRSGTIMRIPQGEFPARDSGYIQGYEEGRAQYKRDTLERLVLGDDDD